MNDDLFIQMWNLQKKLGDRVFKERNIESNNDFLRNLVVAISVECSELLTELQYKWWKDKKPIDKSKTLDESIDIFHFLLQFWISSGFNPYDVFNAFKEKNQKNFQRFFSD
ncbi:MAG: dUTPase [Candidatus Helarchaeota archaeon]